MSINQYKLLLHFYKKPPQFIIRWLKREFITLVDRYSSLRARREGKNLNEKVLLKTLQAPDFDTLWEFLSKNPYPAFTASCIGSEYDKICPGDETRILAAAEQVIALQVDLLGSGLQTLDKKIEWHKDYKSGFIWKNAYFHDIDYHNPDQKSDVKFPWELSRMQWLIPVGQAYLLTGDERYALFVRNTLESWINANPYAYSVNWACTKEVAMRIITWTWFFHVFKNSNAWSEKQFRICFLSMLYDHARFTARYLEYSDINGNHYTADAAGLVFAGLFFRMGKAPLLWQKLGWKILNEEFPRQVYEDGVDFEASIAYHRFSLELFLFPALYRKALGLDISDSYRERLLSMARFTLYYSQNDGAAPLWGDADNGRMLPFGPQGTNDHRYLMALVGIAFRAPDLIRCFSGPKSEPFWVFGPIGAGDLPVLQLPGADLRSKAFPESGFFIMRNHRDHIFIDCGPVGFGGHGGHGHNDCLSFEAILDGKRLITDCGSYVYTASYQERNLFRSTAFHNTIKVDDQEINRFEQDSLWEFKNDAIPEVRLWKPGETLDFFQGSHCGYGRLPFPIKPVRTIILDHCRHILVIRDWCEGEGGEHTICITLNLHPDVSVLSSGPSKIILHNGHDFDLIWGPVKDWQIAIEPGKVSPGYGVAVSTTRLVWRRAGNLDKPLTVCLSPSGINLNEQMSWVDNIIQTVNQYV